MKNKIIENFPVFSKLDIKKCTEELRNKLGKNKKLINKLLNDNNDTWDKLINPLEKMQYELDCLWSTISHLHSVCINDDLRAVYKDILPEISEYYSELGQNKKLYEAFKYILGNKEQEILSQEKTQYLKNEIRDFKLAGVDLPEQQKNEFTRIQIKLSELSNKFKENVLDATQKWNILIDNKEQLAGLPERTLQEAQQFAKEDNKKGYLFNLDYSSYIPIIRFAKDRNLREKIYHAYSTRASSLSYFENKYDNSKIIEEILINRQEIAKLLEFNNYAEYSLQTKMCPSTQAVLHFLNKLLDKSKNQAKQEFQELVEFAKTDGIEDFSPWDIEYYREKYKLTYFNISQEQIREYFPIQQVIQGLFQIVNKLFGLTIVELKKDIWHDDVKVFAINDFEKNRGYIYFDLYTRKNKQGGAWMDECRTRFQISNDTLTSPIAYLTCNFTPPINEIGSLLTHDEVITLFHEFGHCLHHILTKSTVLGVSGVNGVPWDAVELPSQLLENWCWNYDSLSICSKHYQTGDKLPKQVFDKLLLTKNYHSAIKMLRQLEFALFDFEIHLVSQPMISDYVQDILDKIRSRTSMYSIPPYNKFQNSFSHIFAGGYAAGYYSYKWAEVLSCDAFSKFDQEGILNAEVGLLFMENILEKGGTEDIGKLFKIFRGRDPIVEPLLKQSGICSVSE